MFIDAEVVVRTAFVSPFRSDRDNVRALVPEGDFIEIFCDTGLEVYEQRDPKEPYAKARAREIKEFTGISSHTKHRTIRSRGWASPTRTPEETVAGR